MGYSAQSNIAILALYYATTFIVWLACGCNIVYFSGCYNNDDDNIDDDWLVGALNSKAAFGYLYWRYPDGEI